LRIEPSVGESLYEKLASLYGGRTICVEPKACTLEWWPLPNGQPDNAAIEISQFIDETARGAKIKVVEAKKLH
jgi:hypothetical protein